MEMKSYLVYVIRYGSGLLSRRCKAIWFVLLPIILVHQNGDSMLLVNIIRYDRFDWQKLNIRKASVFKISQPVLVFIISSFLFWYLRDYWKVTSPIQKVTNLCLLDWLLFRTLQLQFLPGSITSGKPIFLATAMFGATKWGWSSRA